MTPLEAFTIRTNKEKVAALDALAIHHDRSRNYLVNQAIDYFLELNEWQVEKINQGVQAVKAGDFASEKEVKRVFSKYAPKK